MCDKINIFGRKSKLIRLRDAPVIYLDYLLLSLKTDKEVTIGPSGICNYISAEYNRRFPKLPQDSEPSDGPCDDEKRRLYFYPRLQYKIIRGGPIILAINEGCEMLWDLYDRLDELSESQVDWKITEKRLIEKKVPFGIGREQYKYRFLTPWLSLSEDSFKKYLLLDEESRQRMAIKHLDSHLRSISESLQYTFDGDLRIKTNIKANYIFQRDIHVAGLFGSFIANFEVPSFMGIGKSVSRGFGTVKQV